MNLREAICRIEVAEDLFVLLGLTFDSNVLATHRVQILRRFGQEMEALEKRNPPLSEAERPVLYETALQRTHELYAKGGSDIEPLFRPRPRDMVSLDRLRRSVAKVTVT